MGANLILPFAQGAGANVSTQVAYAGDAQLPIGNQPGVARSAFANKAWLQSSAIAAGVAQFLADCQAADITDQLAPTALSTIIRNALNGTNAFITQSAGDATNKPATTAFVGAAIANTVGAGQVAHYPATSAPTGYVKANGALLSRTTYSALWGYAQTTGNMAATDGAWVAGQFSPGDGATTFRIPDLRGYHLRAFDDARGVDSGRVIGSVQADQFPSHTHGVVDPGHTHATYDPSHFHTYGDPGHSHLTNLNQGANGTTGAGAFSMRDGSNPVSTGNYQTTTSTIGIAINYANTGITNYSAGTGITTTTATGAGSETRVKNIAFLACLKY